MPVPWSHLLADSVGSQSHCRQRGEVREMTFLGRVAWDGERGGFRDQRAEHVRPANGADCLVNLNCHRLGSPDRLLRPGRGQGGSTRDAGPRAGSPSKALGDEQVERCSVPHPSVLVALGTNSSGGEAHGGQCCGEVA